MIRYCVGALFLVACGTVGTVKDPPVYDPAEEATPASTKYAEPARNYRPRSRCDVPFADKRAELLYRINCLTDGVGGA